MATNKYRYTGPLDEVVIPDFGATVKRGETVEVEGEINHPHFEPVKSKGEKETA